MQLRRLGIVSVALLSSANGFVALWGSSARGRVVRQASADTVVVIGRPDGTASNVAHSLHACGFTVRALLHSRAPGGWEDSAAASTAGAAVPAGVEVRPVDLASGGAGNEAALAAMLRGAQHVVLAADGANANLEAGSGACADFLGCVGKMVQSCGGGVQSLVCLAPANGLGFLAESSGEDDAADADDGLLSGAALGESFSMPSMPKLPDLGGFFGGGASGQATTYEALAQVATASGARKVCVVRHGRIFGGTPGQEPVPFTTGPCKAPRLAEHFEAQAVALSASSAVLRARDNNPLGRVQQRSGRPALAELTRRLLAPLGAAASGGASASGSAPPPPPEVTLLSLDGAAPTEAEWAAQFARLYEVANGVGLLRVAFDSVPKPQALAQWLTLDWGAATLSTISSYTKRAGARPVVIAPVRPDEGGLGAAVRVRWEDLASDGSMEARAVGALLVCVGPVAGGGGAKWALTVSREGPEPGSSLGTPLPGEDEVASSRCTQNRDK